MADELRARLKASRRVVIKAGTSVVSTPEGYPSLVRLANIVEQVHVEHSETLMLLTSNPCMISLPSCTLCIKPPCF